MRLGQSGLATLGTLVCVATLTGTVAADDTIGGSQAGGVTPVVEGSPPPDSVEVEEEDFKTDQEAVEDDELMDSEFEREDLADEEGEEEDSEGEVDDDDDNGAGQEHGFPLDNDDGGS